MLSIFGVILHVPVQSGSERVLQLMNRKHSVKDFRNFALELQEKFPLFTLSTDLIVGFPGETDADFQETLGLLKETCPTVCNITRFVARKGTVAARIEEANAADTPAVPDSVKHERSAKLFDAFQQIAQENNQRWVGKTCTVNFKFGISASISESVLICAPSTAGIMPSPRSVTPMQKKRHQAG